MGSVHAITKTANVSADGLVPYELCLRIFAQKIIIISWNFWTDLRHCKCLRCTEETESSVGHASTPGINNMDEHHQSAITGTFDKVDEAYYEKHSSLPKALVEDTETRSGLCSPRPMRPCLPLADTTRSFSSAGSTAATTGTSSPLSPNKNAQHSAQEWDMHCAQTCAYCLAGLDWQQIEGGIVCFYDWNDSEPLSQHYKDEE